MTANTGLSHKQIMLYETCFSITSHSNTTFASKNNHFPLISDRHRTAYICVMPLVELLVVGGLFILINVYKGGQQHHYLTSIPQLWYRYVYIHSKEHY